MLLLPGRNLNSRSPHRRVGYMSSPWFQDQQVQYESLLEMNFARIALLCPNLVAIASQPFKVDIGGGVFYTPDFQLTFLDGQKLVVEVKPSVFVGKHEAKLRQASEVLENNGFVFLLATEKQIYADDRHDRASIYIRYARSHYSIFETKLIKERLSRFKYPQSIHSLTTEHNIPHPLLMHLIGVRFLALAPDLKGDELYIDSQESRHGCIPPSAWIGHQGWQ